MRSPRSRQSTLLTTAGICAAAAILFLSPPQFEGTIRAAVLDIVVSGQDFAMCRYQSLRRPSAAGVAYDEKAQTSLPSMGTAPQVAPNDDRLRELDLACRRLRVENARLREELKLAENYGVSPISVSKSRPAESSTVLRAAIVSRETLQLWRSVRHLNQGRAHGVVESALVLDESQPHIDEGSDAGLQPELDVFIGRCVVGRIANVGRWTSTLELVTDPHYRALAQIIRPTDQGGSFGTLGILVGQGTPLCKLNDVPTTQSVRVGDEIYTSNRDGRTPVPLYYGRVVRVEEGGRHWDITVEPAVKLGEIKSVEVLKVPAVLGKILAE